MTLVDWLIVTSGFIALAMGGSLALIITYYNNKHTTNNEGI